LRKLAAALLAVPVIALIYVPVVLRRSIAARIGIAMGVGTLVAVGAFGLISPSGTTATPPLAPIVPLPTAAFSSAITTGTPLDAPMTLRFSAPMDATSVEAALQVEPRTAIQLSWDSTGTRLTITPRTRWTAATYHTITVPAGALGQSGRPMSVPARQVFVTRPSTAGSIQATDLAGSAAKVTTGFRITFSRPVDIAAVRRALQMTPEIRGGLDVAAAPAGSSAFVFTPADPLDPAKTYEVRLVGLVDADGSPLAEVPTVSVTTAQAPVVVRFRPAHGTTTVERGAILSVRFSQSMERRSTMGAFVVSIAGKPIKGAVSFAEKDTVLVFKPAEPLPYGAEIQMRVNQSALGADGAPLAAARSVRVRVEPAPAPPRAAAPARTTSRPTTTTSTTISSGGSVGSGSWGAVESYYLRLMNCTRTGGLVTSSGSCSSPGGRNVAALKLDSGITTKVSRPYAKLLATGNICNHFIGGNPGDRLRRAGYTSYIWAENLGCRSGDPFSAVLGSHLFFQSERSYNGGHYVNLMNAKYDRAGIGVWVSSGRVRLVVDFYHPR
jgi:uncharacterized protein YkwD